MDRRYIRNYFVIAVAGVFCWFNANTVSAQTATNLDCDWCVGPGEVGWGAVPWASLDPSLRQALQTQQDMLDALQARVDASEVIVLDFSEPDACVIDQPGHYTLDRDWEFEEVSDDLCFAEKREEPLFDTTHILISANFVTFDLNGFSLRSDQEGDVIVVDVTGRNVTVRNGTIIGGDCFDGTGTSLVVSGGFSNLIENTSASCISVSNSVVRNSNLTDINLHPGSVLENSDISFGFGVTAFSDTIFRFNTMLDNFNGGIRIEGDNVLVEGNVVGTGSSIISIDGNNNTIVRNTLQSEASANSGAVAVGVNGTGNIIDSNIIKAALITGISFSMGGNFYGDNRVSATTPFSGGTTQTDWGGNVSF